MTLKGQQRLERADLATKLLIGQKALGALQIDKASIDGGRRKLEADLGPVRYLSA